MKVAEMADERESGARLLYLAVRNGIEELADLCGLLDVLLFRGQGVRGGQGIDGKHPVDVVQNDQIFLLRDECGADSSCFSHTSPAPVEAKVLTTFQSGSALSAPRYST